MTQIDLSWLCLPLVILPMLVIAFFGTRSRLRYARRLREAQAAGDFSDPSLPAPTSRYRPFAIVAAVGSIIGLISAALLLLHLLGLPTLSPALLFVAAFIGALPAAIFGLLMERSMRRRQ